MAILNNNAVATILNKAIAQATGASEIANLDLQSIIDTGNDSTIIGSVDQFTKSLLNVMIDTYFHETLYENTIKNKFIVSVEEFGSFVRLLSMEFPEAEPSACWRDFSPSESGRATVGTYNVYVPVISSQIMGRTVSWQIPISITEEQLKTAWHNASEMNQFINYIKMVVESAINLHLEEMDMANITNYIAEKIAYAESPESVGVNVVNLVQKYHDEVDENITTVNQFRASADALRWSAGQIDLYSSYMKKVSTMFNNAHKKRHTPIDRQVLLMLSEFETSLKTVSYANTFNPEFVKLSNYETIPYWQGETSIEVTTTPNPSGQGEPVITRTPHSLDFETVSAINVKRSSNGDSVSKSGIVALLCDKYSIMHMIKKHRVAVKIFEPEALTNIYNQFLDNYSNDLTQNGIVFILEDVQ